MAERTSIAIWASVPSEKVGADRGGGSFAGALAFPFVLVLPVLTASFAFGLITRGIGFGIAFTFLIRVFMAKFDDFGKFNHGHVVV